MGKITKRGDILPEGDFPFFVEVKNYRKHVYQKFKHFHSK
jgi:hypothetical protein